MTVDIINLERKLVNKNCTTYEITYTVDKKEYKADANVIIQLIGQDSLKIVQLPNTFYENVKFNGPLIDNLHQIIRQFDEGEVISFPFVLGTLDDKYTLR